MQVIFTVAQEIVSRFSIVKRRHSAYVCEGCTGARSRVSRLCLRPLGTGTWRRPVWSPGPFSAWEPRGLQSLGAPGAGSAFPRSGGSGAVPTRRLLSLLPLLSPPSLSPPRRPLLPGSRPRSVGAQLRPRAAGGGISAMRVRGGRRRRRMNRGAGSSSRGPSTRGAGAGPELQEPVTYLMSSHTSGP